MSQFSVRNVEQLNVRREPRLIAALTQHHHTTVRAAGMRLRVLC